MGLTRRSICTPSVQRRRAAVRLPLQTVMACLLLSVCNAKRDFAMHSISPQLRRLADRARTAEGEPAAWLEADEASALWGAVLDGAVPEIELGALLFALAKGGESTDDLIGLHRALAERLAGAETGGPLRLSFEVNYGHAFRPATRARVQAESQISLEEMRRTLRQRK